MTDQSPVITNVLATRYASPELAQLWSAEGKIVLERQLWIAVLTAQAQLGMDVPDGVIADYEAVVDQVDLASIDARERVTRHDVKARIEEFSELAGHEYIHAGMTSRDLTENVEQLQLKRSMELLADRAVASLARLGSLAAEHSATVMAGRSHNVAAQATTLGKRFASAAEELLVAHDRLRDLIDRYPVRGLKGPVGTQADLVDLLGTPEQVANLEPPSGHEPGLLQRVHQRWSGVPALAGLRGGHRPRPVVFRAVVAGHHDPADGGQRAGHRRFFARARWARRRCRTR